MATRKKIQKTEETPLVSSKGYTVQRKNVVWIETLCLFLIWLLFIIGLGFVFYFKNQTDSVIAAVNTLIIGILFLALVPFIANWTYYSAIWKAMREGKELIYKSLEERTPYSILGNREIWIKN